MDNEPWHYDAVTADGFEKADAARTQIHDNQAEEYAGKLVQLYTACVDKTARVSECARLLKENKEAAETRWTTNCRTRLRNVMAWNAGWARANTTCARTTSPTPNADTLPMSRGLVCREQVHAMAGEPSIFPDACLRRGNSIQQIRGLEV